MQLQEFYDYKNQLMKDLITCENVVKLIDDSVTLKDAYEKLVYKNVFPCEYIPETVQDGKTYICFDVDIMRAVDKTFLLPTLNVWVFTHRSTLILPNGGGVRTDKMCLEICKIINGSRYYGLGELDLYSVKRFAPMTDYQGKVITFYAKDFNRPSTDKSKANKVIPSNRKRGC